MRNTASALRRSLDNSTLLLIGVVLLLATAPPMSAQITWAVVADTDGSQYCGTVNLVTGHWDLIYNYDATVAGLGTYANNLYGGAGNSLVQVNPISCTEIPVGQSSEDFFYLVFGSITGTSPALYGVAEANGYVDLYQVHANDGSTVSIGEFTPSNPTSMSSNCPALYVTATLADGNSGLFSVNTNTGATAEIGDTGVVDITAMVCQSGNLYAARDNSLLCTLNLTNGLATCPGFTARNIFGMAYPPSTPPTFSVLHTFTGGADGAQPWASLILDPAGNLYGTAAAGGTGDCSYLGATGCGTIFQLKPHGTSYTFSPLYSFQGGEDGEFPARPLTRGPNGTYYGTTTSGGEGTCSFDGVSECGTVFNAGPTAQPPRTPLLEFRESVLYRFTGGSDGGNPFSTVVFDQAGNIYGTTSSGGANGLGSVFELTPAGGGTYTETVLYSFAGGSDGANPYDGMTFDTAGNLYGTTLYGGGSTVCQTGCGTVFKLSPSGGGWTESVIYRFQGSSSDGQYPTAGVVIDSAGNLYGNTNSPPLGQGGNGGNYVYELSPNGSNWTYSKLSGAGGGGFGYGRVALDSNGNLYAVTEGGGAFGYGQVSKLALASGIFTNLYNFTNSSDGANPYSGVVVDSNGTVYGTTIRGGSGCHGGCGVVWEITQSTN